MVWFARYVRNHKRHSGSTADWFGRPFCPGVGSKGARSLFGRPSGVRYRGGFIFALPPAVPVSIGHRGVMLFFVISGFLITLLMLREQNRTGTVALKSFYWRRTLRIMPALLFFLFAVFVLQTLGLLHVTVSRWIAALTYTMCYMKIGVSWNVEHTWSLAVEEHFYLIWPFLFCFLKPDKAFKVLIGYVLALPLLRAFLWEFCQAYLDMEYASITQMGSIAMGCIIAYMVQNRAYPKINQKIHRNPVPFLVSGLLMIAVFLILEYVIKKVPSPVLANQLRFLLETFSDPLSSLGFAAIILAVAYAKNSVLFPLLNSRPLIFIGTLSYSLYLWQQLFTGAGALPTTAPVIGSFRLFLLRPALWFPITRLRFLFCASKTGLKAPLRHSRQCGITGLWFEPKKGIPKLCAEC